MSAGTFTIALVGNPNCGKSTLFNALTGASVRVGNWAGVTVEIMTGEFSYQGKNFRLVDLPGTYALNQPSEDCARDEEIAQCFLANEPIDLIINVVSATNLERHCYLTTQCHDFPIPVVIAVNMIDICQKQQCELNLTALSQRLQMPCCPISATRGDGVTALKQMIVDNLHAETIREPLFQLNANAEAAIDRLTAEIESANPKLENARHAALRLLEKVHCGIGNITPEITTAKVAAEEIILEHYHEEADIVLIDHRYQVIHHLMQNVLSLQDAKPARRWTDKLDSIFLHRQFGIPSFLAMMYALFFLAINVGGAFQDFFEKSSEALFVDASALLLNGLAAPSWFILIVQGIGTGISTTLTFIPVIAAMFFFMGLLEDSGYMSRAAFVMDRGMRSLGLSGKSFVPMLIGFGCNVPAVMAARTLDNAKDRILTSMMIPFMSCGARLAIFAVFVAAFFKQGGHNVIFGLYLIGMLTAMLTAFLLRKTTFKGKPAPFIMELPTYQRPHLPKILRNTLERLMSFITRAGKVIVPVCVALSLLNHVTVQHHNDHDTTLIEIVGKTATPVFAPMGLTQENWPATVGLVSGVLAKEVVVGTLNSLYSEIAQTNQVEEERSILEKLSEALWSIPENLSGLLPALANPIAASGPDEQLDEQVYGMLNQFFDGKIGAFAYLLFVLLYFPCISTVAVMKKEIGKRWAWFSMAWSTGFAYAIATNFYQIATFYRHPVFSSIWIGSTIVLFILTLKCLSNQKSYPTPSTQPVEVSL